MNIKLKYKKRFLIVKCKKIGFFEGLIGLMFRSKNYQNLYFEKASDIHSIFVFHKFLAVWLDEKNEIVKIDLVKPFKPLIKKPSKAKKLVEIQINEKNKKILKKLLNKTF